MIQLQPIGYVQSGRKEVEDDFWGKETSVIQLEDELNEQSLDGIETFSHVEVIFYFHLVDDNKIQYESRHPRNNEEWPKVGIFAQRGKNRPNKLGVTTAKLVKREGKTIIVEGLDAVEGTPILDIKPVMQEFLPREKVQQPSWSSELMKNYW
ncbi:tRNA-Thr(GGU) m(6)t(6)A37 methyltransferase TsaA [Salirhabdus euzebyi]|uniref:tRNA-Thr(GGU) m(6)t(6)A37 methyltransferase TsaA n=1 Tax=Salirhabdus euzebyi TaxID=394506 RepID=A0A841Q3P3_9BACI|nr:SAM-dependent methyltransferase [Salirhabdus euzebyi]MBB6453008.1 tRNA-Thr(GGU) m(6)t(6)A37 methyltransferase TsaA [Salirhabdus euzebyi]